MKIYDKCFIDGAWVVPHAPQRFELIDPSTERPIGTLALAGKLEVDLAVQAARRAFVSFSKTSKEERISLLQRIVDRFAAREAELAAAITQEMGAPCRNKIMTGAALDSFKQAIKTLTDYKFEANVDGNLVRREPIGVCGLITAWNWPAQLIATKLGMALAAGCTAVIKPSEYSSVTAILMMEIFQEAGVPQGVVNLVLGDGQTVGHALCTHPDVDMISFTGSTRAGILIAQSAAATVKRVCQELGGKSANLVLQDADLAAAAKWNVTRAFTNSGQSCHPPSRILVHQSQHEELLRLLLKEVEHVRLGDPNDPKTTMGPVINKAQYERIQRYIQIGLHEGASLAVGGPGRPGGLEHGYYIRPTVFSNVRPGMTIEQEEIFGPVLVVLSYATEEEAIRIANGTPYGLGAYVFAGDLRKGYEVGSQLRAGRVFLNGVPSNTAAPMGGYRHSGNGREMGRFGLEEYLEVKAMFGFPEPLDF